MTEPNPPNGVEAARAAKRHRETLAAKQYDEREHIRGEIPSRRLVLDILSIQAMLLRGAQTIKTPTGELIECEIDKTKVASLKAAADIAFKLLNKTVPDLKQIELRADVTEEVLPQAIRYTVVRPEDMTDG